MAKCPICETESDDVLCPKCGYNLSIDQKFHLLSSKMSSKEIEDYQNQIETHKFIYYKLRNEKDYDQQLIQENIELQQQISILQERINQFDDPFTQDYLNIYDDSKIFMNDRKDIRKILQQFDILYVIIVPILVIALFFAVDFITQYLSQYWMFFDYSVVKIVCHALLSSLFMSEMAYLLILLNQCISKQLDDELWYYEECGLFEKMKLSDTFFTILIFFSILVIFSVMLYYYFPIDKKLYSLQYLLGLLLNLPISMIVPFTFLNHTTCHQNTKWIYCFFSLMTIILSFSLYSNQLLTSHYILMQISCAALWISCAISSLIIVRNLYQKKQYDEDIINIPIVIVGICGIYMIEYFLINFVINMIAILFF